jgi:hypothetical protein
VVKISAVDGIAKIFLGCMTFSHLLTTDEINENMAVSKSIDKAKPQHTGTTRHGTNSLHQKLCRNIAFKHYTQETFGLFHHSP